MTELEKVQIYTELFKAYLDKFNKTRDIQWKLNIALWTLIGGTGAFLYGKYIPSLFESIIFLIIFSIVYLFLWAYPIQESIEQDKYIFLKYRNKLKKIIGEDISFEVSSKKSKFKWLFITSGFTIILFGIILLILHSAHIK